VTSNDYNKALMNRLLPIGALLVVACAEPRKPQPPITVFAAASLAKPLHVLTDSFTARTGVVVHTLLGGSMDLQRRITDLGQNPDVLFLVDDRVMAALLPSHVDWYARFATNHIVVAYTARSRFADSVTADNWWRILSRDDVTIGRADAAVAPAGRQALAILSEAESYYHASGLTQRLAARATDAYVRPDAALLAALLETGEVDYVLDYQSVAEQYGFQYVDLPGDLAVPVVYTVAIPRAAASQAAAAEFVSYVLLDAGRTTLSDAHVNLLSVPIAVGTNVPRKIADRVRIVPAAPFAP
jgi:molybdate/tungstate transport system substrate-binding protein